MKRKGIIFGLALATLFSAGAGVALSNAVPTTEPIAAVAEATEAKVSSVRYYSDLAPGWGACVYIDFKFNPTLNYRVKFADTSKISFTNEAGENKLGYFETWGEGLLLNRAQSYVCSVGDTLTFQAGFTATDGTTTYEVKETISYVCKDINANWVVYTGEEEPEPEPEPETELTFADSNTTWYFADTTWSVPAIRFHFNTKKTFGQYQSAETMELIEYKNAYGETLNGLTFIHLNANSYFLLRWSEETNPVYAMVGDVITFKKGFALAGNEKLAQDVSFVVTKEQSGNIALKPEVKTVSLTLNGKIGLNFKFALDSGFVSAGSSMQVVYKKDGVVVGNEALAGKTADANGLYVCTYPIVTKDYKDAITAEIQDANGNVFASKTYSIKEYAEAVKDGDYSTEAKALVEKTVAYCEAARAYFAKETVDKDETTVDLSAYKEKAEGTLPTAIKGVTASLLLEAGTEIRLYLYADSVDGVTCTVNGVAQTPVEAADGKWYVSCKDVAADKLGEGVTFVISDGTNEATLTYSALSYANYVLNDTNAEAGLVNTVKAMYAYSVATEEYVKSLGV